MRFADLQTQVFDRLQMPTNPPDPVRKRVRDEMNQTYRELLGRKSLSRMRRTVLTFASVANTPFAVLPQAVVRVRGVMDRTRNRLLTEFSLPQLRMGDPGLAFATGYPDGYVVLNVAAPVARDPSAATALYVVSTSGSDGTGTKVFIEGVTSDGMYRSVTAPMNGLTPANVSSTISTFVIVSKFYLGSAPVGTVTLTEGSGGTELARIVPGHSYARYTRLHLYGTPTSAITYYADVELHVEDMIQDQDEPILPEDFHWMLPSGAIRLEYLRRKELQQYGIEDGRFRKGLADLQSFIESPQMLQSPRLPQFSQLGAMFPAGT